MAGLRRGEPLPLVLASASPRRLCCCSRSASCRISVIAPDIDETPARDELPRLYAERMARAKAAAVRCAGSFRAGGRYRGGGRAAHPAESRRPRRRCALPGAAVRAAPSGADGGGAGRAGRPHAGTAGGKRRGLRPADRGQIERYLASGEWRRQSRRLCDQGPCGRRSSASCPAAIPAWSACRCSRRRSCCAVSAGRCHERLDPRREQPG